MCVCGSVCLSVCLWCNSTALITSQIQDNVAFNHFGHCYALKEGGEKRTVLDGNLGAGTKDHPRTNMDKSVRLTLSATPVQACSNPAKKHGVQQGAAARAVADFAKDLRLHFLFSFVICFILGRGMRTSGWRGTRTGWVGWDENG